MKPENLVLSLQAVAGSESVLAIGSAPFYPWDEATNKRGTTRVGTSITVVCPAREYEKFSVVIEGQNYDSLFANGKTLNVSFDGFVGRFRLNFRTNEYQFFAKADAMTVLKQ